MVRIGALDSAIMSLRLGQTNQSKVGEVYLGGFNENDTLIPSPTLIFKGFFETCSFTETREGTVAEVSFENDLIKLNRQKELRYTDKSQQSLYPGDLGMQYVAAAEDWSGFWGTAPKVKRIRKRKLNQGTK